MLKHKPHRPRTPVDRGWSWVILIASFFVYMCIVGGYNCFGILYSEMLDHYGATAGDTAWMYGVMLSLNQGLGPISNYCCTKFSFRKVVMFGGFVMFIGYLSSAFVEDIKLMYLTMGVIAGIGSGLSYVPGATIVNLYFEKRRALATGIVVSGAGVGNFIIPHIYRGLLDEYGLKGCLIISSAIYLHICVAASLFRQPNGIPKDWKSYAECSEGNTNREDEESSFTGASDTLLEENIQNENNADDKKESRELTFNWSVFLDTTFVIYSLSLVFAELGHSTNYFMFASHCKDIGVSPQMTSKVLSLAGAAEICGRLFFGWFVDQKVIRVRYIYCTLTCVCGIIAFSMVFIKTGAGLGVYSVLFGLTGGTFFVLVPLLVIESLGMEKFTSAFGMTTFLEAIATLTTIPMAGSLRDLTGNWVAGFYIVGSFFTLASLILFVEPYVSRFVRRMRKKAKAKKEESKTLCNGT